MYYQKLPTFFICLVAESDSGVECLKNFQNRVLIFRLFFVSFCDKGSREEDAR